MEILLIVCLLYRFLRGLTIDIHNREVVCSLPSHRHWTAQIAPPENLWLFLRACSMQSCILTYTMRTERTNTPTNQNIKHKDKQKNKITQEREQNQFCPDRREGEDDNRTHIVMLWAAKSETKSQTQTRERKQNTRMRAKSVPSRQRRRRRGW